MDLFTFCLTLGFSGLALMGFLGALGSHGSHASHGSHGHEAHGFHLHGQHQGGVNGHALHHHGDAVAAAPVAQSHAGAQPHAHFQGAVRGGAVRGGAVRGGNARGQSAAKAPTTGARILSYLSPRVLFAVLLGFGATGLLTAPYLGETPRFLAAAAGGIGLEKLIVSPLFNVLMRFGSNPARTLESALLEEATALTAFDSQGCGLVSIDLDGHEMRVLARLQPEPEPDSQLARVRAGDKLIIEEVDAARGQCRVSRARN